MTEPAFKLEKLTAVFRIRLRTWRMGRLQGLAGPTAANLWHSTYFSFWKLARNVWCGDRDLGRKDRHGAGTVSFRTELMRLDGAVPSLTGVPCFLPLLDIFFLPVRCPQSVPGWAAVETRPPSFLAAGTLSNALPSLAGQTC
jgi:hypothetical protein